MSERRSLWDLALVNRFFEDCNGLGEIINLCLLCDTREKSYLFDLILIEYAVKYCIENIRADSGWKFTLLLSLLRGRLILFGIGQDQLSDLPRYQQLEVLILVKVLNRLVFVSELDESICNI